MTCGMLRGHPFMLATCIMPTCGRPQFVPRAIAGFLAQEGAGDSELLVLDDGSEPVRALVPDHPRIRYLHQPERLVLGKKRNLLCALARGGVIVHWDDDDWYPPDRLRRQLEPFSDPSILASGTSTVYYLNPEAGTAFQYRYFGSRPFVTGNTLAYRRSYWQTLPFAEWQVGEDVRFVGTVSPERLCDLRDPGLCVATIHPGNASPKRPHGRCWQSVDASAVRSLMAGTCVDAVRVPAPSSRRMSIAPPEAAADARDPCLIQESQSALPRVSCIMPTGDRPDALRLSLELFRSQDYPQRELVVVDGGRCPVGALCAGMAEVRYLRVDPETSIGRRRNLACSLATGEIIAHWDDDDWYAPNRLSQQLAPLLEGRADVTGLETRHALVLDDASFWSLSAVLHRRMFVGDVHGGTLAYWRAYRDRGVVYPDVSLAEDAVLLRALLRQGARLERVCGADLFVYIRHRRNAWRFEAGRFLDPAGWSRVVRPEIMPEAMVARYREALLGSDTNL